MVNMVVAKIMDNWEKVLLIGIGLAVGTVVTLILTRSRTQTTTYAVAQAPMEISNLETWDMKELSDGTIRVEVHRNVKRG